VAPSAPHDQIATDEVAAASCDHCSATEDRDDRNYRNSSSQQVVSTVRALVGVGWLRGIGSTGAFCLPLVVRADEVEHFVSDRGEVLAEVF
jgi:hypothetical protein